jgi:hypothetical protein
MEDIHVNFERESVEDTPPSIDNDRKELPWENREEKLLLSWCENCKKRSKEHDVRGKKNKIKFAVFGIPSILIPIILGGFASVVPCHSIIYSVGMMLSGLFSGVSMFFNFAKKTELHFQFSTKYFELANEIDSELIRPKRFRVACNVYMERTKLQYNSLCRNAPTL